MVIDNKNVKSELIAIDIPAEKYFYFSDGKSLKSISELCEYLKTCDWAAFSMHVTEEKNDFANWIEGVFSESKLSNDVNTCKTPQGIVKILESRLYPEKFDTQNNNQMEIKKNEKSALDQKIANQSQLKKEEELKQENRKKDDEVKEELKKKDDEVKEELKKKEKEMEENNARKKSNEEKKITENIEEKNGFRQFSDEELEKFQKFVKREKEPEKINRMEDLMVTIQDLKFQITELRRAERNPIIPDLLLRNVISKLALYSLIGTDSDFKTLMARLGEVQSEIEYCKNEVLINVRKELENELAKTSVIKTGD